jgi:hypothetical protein
MQLTSPLRTDDPHSRGTIALFQFRREQNFWPNIRVERAARRALVRFLVPLTYLTVKNSNIDVSVQILEAVLLGVVVENWLQDGALYGEEGATLAFDALLIRTADLRAKVPALLSGVTRFSAANLEALEEGIAEAQDLQHSLIAWAANLPEHWNAAPPSFPESSRHPSLQIMSHPLQESDLTLGHAVIWNRFHAVRLRVNSVSIELLSALAEYKPYEPSIEQQLFGCRESMGWMAADLCGSIAVLWSSFNTVQAGTGASQAEVRDEIDPQMAVLMTWPLSMSIGVEGIPKEQKDYLQGRLKIITRVLGAEALYAYALEMS